MKVQTEYKSSSISLNLVEGNFENVVVDWRWELEFFRAICGAGGGAGEERGQTTLELQN